MVQAQLSGIEEMPDMLAEHFRIVDFQPARGHRRAQTGSERESGQ